MSFEHLKKFIGICRKFEWGLPGFLSRRFLSLPMRIVTLLVVFTPNTSIAAETVSSPASSTANKSVVATASYIVSSPASS